MTKKKEIKTTKGRSAEMKDKEPLKGLTLRIYTPRKKSGRFSLGLSREYTPILEEIGFQKLKKGKGETADQRMKFPVNIAVFVENDELWASFYQPGEVTEECPEELYNFMITKLTESKREQILNVILTRTEYTMDMFTQGLKFDITEKDRHIIERERGIPSVVHIVFDLDTLKLAGKESFDLTEVFG